MKSLQGSANWICDALHLPGVRAPLLSAVFTFPSLLRAGRHLSSSTHIIDVGGGGVLAVLTNKSFVMFESD